ncbi:MAG: Txe/YoeB family addiction module toxin [Defluviitaleaceae bacterium]|nr:Txe/YoeB family addiction module toxin [Defluviitaleaceae bacterium]
MKTSFHEQAWEDYEYWQTQDKKTLKKVNNLIRDIKRNPFNGIGHPEPLKHELQGWWSREIDDKNRIVYKSTGNIIEILQCKDHYDDR